MTTDERNFRSAYYEKVGCRGVEEKKSFEILLKDKPLNRIKLIQFCLRFTVPAVHRELIWSLLLGVTPLFTDSREYVMTQRIAVYQDLLKVLKTLRIIDDKTPKSKMFYAMWLLENRYLTVGFNFNVENNFVILTEILLQTLENEVEIYWISKKFYELTLEITNDFSKLRELTFTLLEKEDSLYRYLVDNNILNNLPLEKWYSSCFAGVIQKRALVKIWDKICCGSRKILIFVFLVLINTLWRRMLKKHKDLKGFLEGINNIKDDQEIADQIANKAIELWELNKEKV